MAFSSLIEPMRNANLRSGQSLYRWRLLSVRGGPVHASAGVSVDTMPLGSVAQPLPDTLLVCGGLETEHYRDRELEAFLRRLARHGVVVGAVSTGSWLLAHAGLLDDRPCTVHWAYVDAFREAFPELDVQEQIFLHDGERVTCAGGTAALDLMLAIIREDHGAHLANRVSENFIHGFPREAHAGQRMDVHVRLGLQHPSLVRAVEIMENALEQPLAKASVAHQCGVSLRQLERLFKRYLGMSPARFYMQLRLNKARKLLRQTTLPVTEVYLACGFQTGSHFSKCYRDAFACRPSDERVNTPSVSSQALRVALA